MKAVILAAGYGTRLGLDVPKHLIKVAGKEMLVRLLEKLDLMQEIDGIFVVTNEWGYQATKDMIDKYKFGTAIQIFNDGTIKNDDRLGTLGDLLFTVEQGGIQEDTLIIAGDNLFEFELSQFVEFYRQKKSDCLVLFDVKDLEVAKRMGIAAIDENSRIIQFVEKPENPPSTLAGTLCYILTKDTLMRLRLYRKAGNNMDKAGSFIEYLHVLQPVHGWVTEKTWFDIGDKKQLEKAERYFFKI